MNQLLPKLNAKVDVHQHRYPDINIKFSHDVIKHVGGNRTKTMDQCDPAIAAQPSHPTENIFKRGLNNMSPSTWCDLALGQTIHDYDDYCLEQYQNTRRSERLIKHIDGLLFVVVYVFHSVYM